MFSRNLCLSALVFLASALALHAAPPAPDVLTTVPAHPRLIFLDSDLPGIKANIAADTFAAATFAELQRHGNDLLAKQSRVYVLDGNEHDLLNTARAVEDVVVTCSGLYRLTGERKYADRAIAEMFAAGAFKDWNPIHFLDTAELTAALAIGYDWLYPILTPQQRSAIHAAIVVRGMDPWLTQIGPKSEANPRPFNKTNNWVQVCVGGETLGALALADEEPARARTILTDGQKKMREIMKLFAPDGGFEEGPTYWGYATSYNVLYLAALDSVLHNDFGLSQMPGFADTGNYRIQAIGPAFELANFGDAHERLTRAPQMFWMANKFHKPDYALAERRIYEFYSGLPKDQRNGGESDRFMVFALVFYHPPPAGADPVTVASYSRTDQAFLRSGWSLPNGKPDVNAFFIALKGGSAKASHGHLDIGSFVLDALGERWALDLGPEQYGVPHYFDFSGTRWTYFRTRTESHNTLTVDSANEDLDTYAHLTAVGQSASGLPKYAVLDLNSAYKSPLKSWQRGVEVLPGPRILIQDELTPKGSTDIVWRILTHADIKLTHDHADATLSLNGKKLYAHIVSPAGAQFETLTPPSPAPPQTALHGVTDLIIHFPKLSKAETITVVFSGDGDASKAPASTPMAQWSAAK